MLAGNKGIGYEIARLLAEAGMTVVVASRSEDKGQEAMKKLSELPSKWYACVALWQWRLDRLLHDTSVAAMHVLAALMSARLAAGQSPSHRGKYHM